MAANGKMVCTADSQDGFVKVLKSSNTGIILGAWIIAPNATEMIAEVSVAI